MLTASLQNVLFQTVSVNQTPATTILACLCNKFLSSDIIEILLLFLSQPLLTACCKTRVNLQFQCYGTDLLCLPNLIQMSGKQSASEEQNAFCYCAMTLTGISLSTTEREQTFTSSISPPSHPSRGGESISSTDLIKD